MLYMFLAEGFEETEAIGALDVIKRAGIDIKTVGIGKKEITGSHGITVVADLEENEAAEAPDGVILPGGMPGTLNLKESGFVRSNIEKCFESGKLIAAICAAPMVFGTMGLLKGKKATCYPGFEKYLEGCEYTGALTERCGNIITGKGAGAAMLFGAETADYFKPGSGEKILGEIYHK